MDRLPSRRGDSLRRLQPKETGIE